MQNFIFGKVLQRVDSDGKRYFINLGTGDKVLAKGTIKANKIELIPSRVSLKDLEYAEKKEKLLVNRNWHQLETFLHQQKERKKNSSVCKRVMEKIWQNIFSGLRHIMRL